MPEKKYDFSIIYEELDRLSEESKLSISDNELIEYEEIRILGDIVIEMNSPDVNYFTST